MKYWIKNLAWSCGLSVLAVGASGMAQAQESPAATNAAPTEKAAPAKHRSYGELDATLDGVLKALVDNKSLSPEQAARIKADAAAASTTTEAAPAAGEKVIRVPYVTEDVKQQIRDDVQMGLQESTVQSVLAQAKQERWGVPGVLPEWINKLKFKGDVRVRLQQDNYAPENGPESYYDFNVVNSKGGVGRAGPDAFLNTTQDRFRMRTRARFGVDAAISNNLKAGLRLSTGNTTDPVSTNQTLGTYDNRYQVVWDQVFLEYKGYDVDRYHWLTVTGGRMPNPWLYSDLVWDHDLAFEGVAATMRMNMNFGGGGLLDDDEQNRTLALTVGAFPLQEVELSGDDKWMYGTQVTGEWITLKQAVFKIGLAYYAFDHVVGQHNEFESHVNDYTAPRFFQKGNSTFDILNDNDEATNLAALGSDYDLIDVTATMDWAYFAPAHVYVTLDYVKNIGYQLQPAAAAELGAVSQSLLDEKTTGYQALLTVGWPDVGVRGNWRAHLAYRYLERDAVLDAFTDSDFHLGGTDAKGWIIGGDYGLMENTWVSARYMSSDAIDGPPLGIDTVQLDINARF